MAQGCYFSFFAISKHWHNSLSKFPACHIYCIYNPVHISGKSYKHYLILPPCAKPLCIYLNKTLNDKPLQTPSRIVYKSSSHGFAIQPRVGGETLLPLHSYAKQSPPDALSHSYCVCMLRVALRSTRANESFGGLSRSATQGC